MNEKIKELGEWYLELYENDNGFSFDGSNITCYETPNLRNDLSLYKVNPPKPKLKIIDLSMMIGSDILMEFSKNRIDWRISKLKFIHEDAVPESNKYETKCRIMENLWHNWAGGKCPLPKGLIVQVRNRDDWLSSETSSYGTIGSWEKNHDYSDIIAFKVIGKKDGYIYEWEQG